MKNVDKSNGENMHKKTDRFTKKEIIEKLYKFYIDNLVFIDDYLKNDLKQIEKNNFIRKIFELLKYSEPPLMYDSLPIANENLTLYRGINSINEEKLKYYINQFVEGPMYFGIGPFVYGTGIYTCTNQNIDIAIKYATNSFKTNNGAIIQCKLKQDTKIINYEKIIKYQFKVLKDLEDIFEKNYIEILSDCSIFAALLGYECIYVESMDYFVILNRGKIIIEDINYCNESNVKKLSFKS